MDSAQTPKVSTDIEDMAPATPTKPVAALLLQSPTSPMDCHPVNAVQHSEASQPFSVATPEDAEAGCAQFKDAAQQLQSDSADAARTVGAALSEPAHGADTGSLTGCGLDARPVEDVITALVEAGRAMKDADSESSASEQPHRSV